MIFALLACAPHTPGPDTPAAHEDDAADLLPIPAQCRDYVSCVSETARTVDEVEAVLASHGDGGSCWQDPALYDVCLRQCDDERDARVWQNFGDVPDACWVEAEPCTVLAFVDTLCPDAYETVGFLACSLVDEEEAACVAASILDCAPYAANDVGECMGLRPGRYHEFYGFHDISPGAPIYPGCDPTTLVPNNFLYPSRIRHEESYTTVYAASGMPQDTSCTTSGGDMLCTVERLDDYPYEVEFYWDGPGTVVGSFHATPYPGCEVTVPFTGAR